MPGMSLTFNRLYNSANADSGIGLGQCWHYSYAVSLFDSGQLDQLVAYSESFPQTVYHTNSTDLAAYFTERLLERGVTTLRLRLQMLCDSSKLGIKKKCQVDSILISLDLA